MLSSCAHYLLFTVLITQLFAPTSFHVTFETDGMGALSLDDIVFMAKKDSDGNLVGLNLPRKFVFTSNHQVYADWWYAWSFFYFFGSDVHKYVYITLKKSLKWCVRVQPACRIMHD